MAADAIRKLGLLAFPEGGRQASVFDGSFNEMERFKSVEELEKSSAPCVLALSMDSGREAVQGLVRAVRSSERLYLSVIAIEDSGVVRNSSLDAELRLEDLAGYAERAESLRGQIAELPSGTWEGRLLSFLYTRPERTVVPVFDKSSDKFYRYSVADQFAGESSDCRYWLEDMAGQGILSRTPLIDRIFCCPHCGSSMLKFSDHCPSCGSINIRNERFIHCFSCGHVAPEREFQSGERLVCKSCGSKLKLIGEDYDRPLENYLCADCGAAHMESSLEVCCASCGKKFSTESLGRRSICGYKLADLGRDRIRYGSLNLLDSLASGLSLVSAGSLVQTLDWLMKMQLRYEDFGFSLLALRVSLSDGAPDYEAVLEFSKLLRDTFRSTDFCAKLDNSTFLFLYPRTGAQGMEAVCGKISAFVESMTYGKGKFSAKMESFSSTRENVAGLPPQQLISSLEGRL